MAENRNGRPTSAKVEAASVSDGNLDTSSVDTAPAAAEKIASPAVYRTSPVKRSRRTRAEIEALDEAIIRVCTEDNPITVRGVFYRVMSAGVVAKTEKSYSAVQREVLKLRRAGVLPYSWIADGSRTRIKSQSWDSVEQALRDAAVSYRRALWRDQDAYVEIWSEKDAITTIIADVTDTYDVPLMIARGFASESFLWSTAETLRYAGKPAVVYQLGDHDPSGVAAWKHVQDRLRAFAPEVEIAFERIAVTEEQIATLGLPTRPTKASDSRARNFVGESVEVDAIPTRVLKELVSNAIERHIDPKALERTRFIENQERIGLEVLAHRGLGVRNA